MPKQVGNYDYFLLRRLQSLLGIFPLGCFLFIHFTLNSFALGGSQSFNFLVKMTHGFPLVGLLEIFFIAIPLLIHILLGIIIIYRGSVNIIAYSYYRNWMYFFQRFTGVVAFLFVIYHVWSTRLHALFIGKHVTFAYMQGHFSPMWVKIFYFIGILSAVFHLANGLATALITWGITVSKRSQLVMAIVTWVIIISMGFWSMRILIAFIS